ncbi:MAG: UTP--glucose-1-phosphate uridylyltransferase GalU [Alphaproteobacteria bacterium]
MIKPVRKAVFPVGGMGTRFLPATKAMPKEMLPVVDKPLIQYAVEEAQAAGIEEFIFVTGRGKSAIEDHFDRSVELELLLAERDRDEVLQSLMGTMPTAGEVSYTRQQSPQGLGHAVWCARHLVGDEPFAILLADDLIKSRASCLKQMIDAYQTVGGNMIAAMEVPHEHTSRYGVIDPGSVKGRMIEVKGLVEKPSPAAAPSNQAVIGRYVLQPQVFEYLSGHEKGAGGEIQLTDALAKMIGSTPFNGYRFEGKRFDCGDKVGFLGANLAFALDREELRDGVLAQIAELKG